jgi:hypothetical protein
MVKLPTHRYQLCMMIQPIPLAVVSTGTGNVTCEELTLNLLRQTLLSLKFYFLTQTLVFSSTRQIQHVQPKPGI